MNFSIYVLLVLLSFCLIENNFSARKQAISKTHTAYLACKKTDRMKRNAEQEENYSDYFRKNKPQSEGKKRGESPPSTLPHRERTEEERVAFLDQQKSRRRTKLSTLNLAHLGTSTPLRHAAIDLIVSLYEETSLMHNASAPLHEIATLIVDSAAQQQGATLLERLKEARIKQPLLNKMLKGTSVYDIDTHVGYPPLIHFLCFNPHDSKAVHFHYASEPLLDVLFGQRTSLLIRALEYRKWKVFSRYPHLNKRELFTLLQKEHVTGSFDELETHLTFSR